MPYQNTLADDCRREKSVVFRNRLYCSICRAIESNELRLPTIPELAVKLRRAIDGTADSDKISRLVQLDPSITAQLVRIANSPGYRGRRRIESCPEALTRLGLRTAREIVTGCSLNGVFMAKSPHIRKRMQELWVHSSYVAAISAAIALKTPGFDPDRAMLAGLLHDIGAVPILACADEIPELAAHPEDIDSTVQMLRSEVGTLIMRRWNFPEDFAEIVAQADNWRRDHKEAPDYSDIVIVAQLHSFIGQADIHKLPPMDTLPAYRKLGAGRLDSGLSMDILDQAREEIQGTRQLLSA